MIKEKASSSMPERTEGKPSSTAGETAASATKAAPRKATAAKTTGPGQGNVATDKAPPTSPPPGRGAVSQSAPSTSETVWSAKLVGSSDHHHGLSPRQYAVLLSPLAESRVQQLKTGSRAKYVESWDVIRYLDRIFGLTGWSDDVDYRLVSERIHPDPREGKTGDVVSVVYTAHVVLTIKCPVCGEELTHFSDVGGGDQLNQPLNNIGDAHGSAAKGAVSDALKRCARKLGDQFGLPLYDKDIRPIKAQDGSLWYPAVVGNTAVPPVGMEPPAEVRTDDTVTGGDDVPEPAPELEHTGHVHIATPATVAASLPDGYVRATDMPHVPHGDSALAASTVSTTTTQAPGGRPAVKAAAPAAIPVKDCPAPEGTQLRDGHAWIDSNGGGAGKPRQFVCTRKHGMVLPEPVWESDTPLPITMPEPPVYGPSGMDTFVPPVTDVPLPEAEAVAAIANAFPEAEEVPQVLGQQASAMRAIVSRVPDIAPGMGTFWDQIMADMAKWTNHELVTLVTSLAKRCDTTDKLLALYGHIAQNMRALPPAVMPILSGVIDAQYEYLTGMARPKNPQEWALGISEQQTAGEPVL